MKVRRERPDRTTAITGRATACVLAAVSVLSQAVAPAAPCLAAIVLAWPGLASAWGPLGHQAVGAVAQERLSPRARAQVDALLVGDLGADGAPSGRTTLAQVASWADEIRGSEADHPRWHFDNAPVCSDPGGQACPNDDCASRRVASQLALLADPGQPQRTRNEALKWVVHLVGDMHQPLHAADYAQGATHVAVELEGHSDKHALTLHGAWDVRLVDAALRAGHERAPPPQALRMLLKKAAGFDPARLRAAPQRWVQESNALARTVALDYPGFACGANGGGTDGAAAATPAPTQPVVLSRAYQQRAMRVIDERLALAGARLAQVLNDALDR
jgi:hypothetical protein